MSQLFPSANIVAGVLIFVTGFCAHWLGQTISLVNWRFAERIGLQERGLLPEYRVYEHAIAVADFSMGWLYGVAALGLIIDAEWGYKLAWIPGSILTYHAVSAWVWERNRRLAGHRLWSDTTRLAWCAANAVTGLLAIAVAWAGYQGH